MFCVTAAVAAAVQLFAVLVTTKVYVPGNVAVAFCEVVPPLNPAPLHWYVTPAPGPPVKAAVKFEHVKVVELEAVGDGAVVFCVTAAVAAAVQLFAVLVTTNV